MVLARSSCVWPVQGSCGRLCEAFAGSAWCWMVVACSKR